MAKFLAQKWLFCQQKSSKSDILVYNNAFLCHPKNHPHDCHSNKIITFAHPKKRMQSKCAEK